MKREEALEAFSKLISFADQLRDMDENTWVTPYKPGKWTIRDIVTHIALWDQYFLENAIQKITNGEPLTLENLNYEEFNQSAIEYAKSKTKDEILDLTISVRQELYNQVKAFSDEAYQTVYNYADNKKFSLDEYLLDFISHDEHHIKQIEPFLQSK